jgi:ABC-type proline/glycine betaine transport system substrate-binding protein
MLAGAWNIPTPDPGRQRPVGEPPGPQGGVATRRELVRGARAWAGLALVGAALALLGAGCGDDEPAPGEKPGEDVTLRIAVNPWTGSAVNANVAKILLERELGYNVELVEIDENSQFPEIASDRLDASLEVWPSGHAADINRYIEGRRGGFLRDGGILDVGDLGLIGNIGWWVPTYLVEQQPELARWQGLKGREDLVNGEFLAGDPTFVSYDTEIIKSLGLDLKVVNTGSERALIQAIDEAYKAKEPFLAYTGSTTSRRSSCPPSTRNARRRRASGTARATTATTPTTFFSRWCGLGSRTRRARRSISSRSSSSRPRLSRRSRSRWTRRVCR